MRTKVETREVRLKVNVSAADQAALQERASNTGLTVSSYLRTVGLGYQPSPVLDHRAIEALMRLNADQGRLGGLLKLWLTSRPNEAASVDEVRGLLRQIEDTQLELREFVQRASARL